MTRTLGELIWRITGDTSQFDKSAKNTSAQVKTLEKTGTSAFNGIKLSSIAMGIGASAAFMKVVSFTKEALDVTRDAQEVISKYGAVFGGMGDASEEAATRFADSFDLANATAKEMLSNTGNLLQGFGATRAESLALSEQVNTLASDLASFTNNQGGAKVASEALTKALLGEREQAKTLGIAILESDVQTRLAQKGQDTLTGSALKLAKAQVTLEIITEQAKNSIGDYARTADSAANVQKRAGENTKELQIALGTYLMPAVTILAAAWGDVAGKIAEVLAEHNKLREAQMADKAGNATLEQRILLVQQEKKGLEQLLVAEKNIAAQYGISETEEGKQIKAALKGIDDQIAGMKRFQADVKKGELTQAEANARAEAEAKRLQALNDKYLEQRAKITAILEDNKSEYQVLQEQIDELNLSWAKGSELENERLQAIDILKDKQLDLFEGAIKLSKEEEDSNERARQSEIEKAKAMGFPLAMQDKLIASINEYYDDLEKSESIDKFIDNMSTALEGVSSLFSALSDYSDAIYERRIALLEGEMEAEMEAAGVAEDTAVEKAQKEYDAAVAGGDAQTIEEARQNLERTKIQEKYDKKKAELEYKAELQSWELKKLSAAADMAQSIMVAAKSAPWPWNLIPIAFATAIGGIQLGTIAASKPVKSYETGGIVPGGSGTLVNVAENGSDEILFNTGESGKAFASSMASEIAKYMGGASGQTIHVTLEVDGEKMAENTMSYVRKGIVRGEQ